MAKRSDIRKLLALIADGTNADVPAAVKTGWRKFRKNKARSGWLDDPRIQGFGMAPKIKDGEILDEYVLKVYVDAKVELEDIQAPVPPFVVIPGIEGRIATDVDGIGKVRLDAGPPYIAHFIPNERPALPGYSVSHPESGSGTFGCIVTRDDELFILSNAHVIANDGLGNKGDDPDPILYPGVGDGGSQPNDIIGRLADFVPIKFGEHESNLVDAAIARVLSGNVRSFIPMIGVPNGVNETIREKDRVFVFGRTSGYQSGTVLDLDAVVKAEYKLPDGSKGLATLKNQVKCTNYSKAGDSGAAVVDERNNVVGLHFASTDNDTASFFNPISAVTRELDVRVVTYNV
jgi:Trypsin-like peptidase domain